MKIKFLPYKILIIINFGCFKDSSSINISGVITNPTGKEVVFNYPDTSYRTPINSNGRFNISFQRDSSEYLYFRHGNEATAMYINPGSKISLSIDTEMFDETIEYHHSEESSFLARKYLINEKQDLFGEHLYLKNKEEYHSIINTHENQILLELNNVSNESFKEKEIESIAIYLEQAKTQKEKLSEYTQDELTHLWNKRILDKEYNFYDMLDKTTSNEFELNLSSYQSRLMKILSKIKDPEFKELEKSKIEQSITKWKERRKIYDNMPIDGDESIDFIYPDINGDSISLSTLRGNLVYVDVWATWCGPCIAQMPALKRLQKDYTKKRVTFLSVSVDTDKNSWIKMVTEENLGGLHMWANGWSEITTSYAIFGIPRFMLIDFDGKIISVNAPRPNDDAIRDLLNENLKF